MRVDSNPTGNFAREPDGHYTPLFVKMRPSLYRTNVFRVLGIPVDATASDIRRQANMVQKSLALGLPIPSGPSPLPLETPADAASVGEALQRLGDPEQRLLEELFWLWPSQTGQSRNDAALTALTRGDVSEAVRVWHRMQDGVGLHNLAVLAHTRALDLEATEQDRGLTSAEETLRDHLWSEALQHWKALVDEEAFWHCFTARIHDLDDPRLPVNTAKRVRASLPPALLAINAQFVMQHREGTPLSDQQRHLRLITESGFPLQAGEEALQMSLEPVRQHLQGLCRNAAAEANEDPRHADDITERLLDKSGPLLALLDSLPIRTPMCDALHDEVAQSALDSLYAVDQYAQEADQRPEAAKHVYELLRRIEPIPASVALRRHIQERVQEGEEFLGVGPEWETCWFCSASKPESAATCSVPMVRGRRVVASRTIVRVPRCGTCLRWHVRAQSIAGVIAMISNLLVVIYLVRRPSGPWWGYIFELVMGWFEVRLFVSITIKILVGSIKDQDAVKKYPAVVRHKKDGWALGEGLKEAIGFWLGAKTTIR